MKNYNERLDAVEKQLDKAGSNKVTLIFADGRREVWDFVCAVLAVIDCQSGIEPPYNRAAGGVLSDAWAADNCPVGLDSRYYTDAGGKINIDKLSNSFEHIAEPVDYNNDILNFERR